MCGIVGASSKDVIDPSEVRILLLLAQDRGGDSTGLAIPDEIIKKAESADEFVSRHIPETNQFIGHTRAKTTGAISDRNAHPFKVGSLVGTHNGMISNWFKLKKDEGINDIEVDSEIIWHLMGKYGLEETIPKLQGSFALAWLDSDNDLNLYRHSNPIWIGRKQGSLYYGSNKYYLEVIDCEDIESLKEHHHLVIRDGEVQEEVDLSHIKPKQSTSYYGAYPYQGYQRTPQKRPVFAPNEASFVETLEGDLIYYWFNPTNTIINIEPVYKGTSIPSFRESYVLSNPKNVDTIENFFPEVLQSKKVQQIIKSISKP